MYKIGIGSTNNPLSNIFAYSYHMSGWYCIDDDIVRRNFTNFVHTRITIRWEWRTHTAKNSIDKGGIDLLAILMDYYSPSKHDFGEIHLYFKMIDKQFFTCINNMAAF